MDIVFFIVGIAILIILHELGHFLAARLCGIDVEEFGIGFPPPRLFTFAKIKGTEFTLNGIPLGGFVRIKGENDPDIPDGLSASSPWKRLVVISAGPLMNILIGILLSVIIFYRLGEPIPDRVKIIGIAPGSPAEAAGLQNGDVILQVEGEKIDSIDELHNIIYNRLGQPTLLVYERDNDLQQVVVTPRTSPPPNEGAIGILMGNDTKPTTWYKAIPRGINASFSAVISVLSLPKLLLSGEVDPGIVRPVGYKGMYDVYRQVRDPLQFFTMITMSLGVFNLFPIPALDGGRIFFSIGEIITRRRLPPRIENAIHFAGFVFLIALLIIVNIMDFISPVKMPF